MAIPNASPIALPRATCSISSPTTHGRPSWRTWLQGEQIPSEAFDCIILTQTLHLIYDVPAAIRTLHRVLKPGGVVLATVPGLAKVSRYDMDRWGDHWRFTTRSAHALFAEVFLQELVTVRAYGNILAAVSFLHGLSAQDLRHSELEHHDPDYELLVAIRAEKLRTDS